MSRDVEIWTIVALIQTALRASSLRGWARDLQKEFGMRKTAIGVLLVLAMAAGWFTPAAASAPPYNPWGWMYLSTEQGHYTCSGTYNAGDNLQIFVVLECPNWGSADAYFAMEAGVTYPTQLFNTRLGADEAPNAQFFLASCTGGHCSWAMGTGTPIYTNPWTAVTLEFVGFNDLVNLGFSLTPRDDYSLPTLGGPGWAYYDPQNPVTLPLQAGDGTDAHPGWQQGFVMVNYDNTAAMTNDANFPDTVFRDDGSGAPWPLLSEGDPCLRNKIVPSQETSWGSLKAAY